MNMLMMVQLMAVGLADKEADWLVFSLLLFFGGHIFVASHWRLVDGRVGRVGRRFCMLYIS